MSEVRLIDANALRKNMEFVCMGIMAGTEPYNAPLTEIDNAPTVEIPVARWDCYCEGQKVGYEKALSERPQGEWEYNQYDGNPNIGNWHCSECRHIVYGGYSQKPYYNFCPNCGADMRGKKNENR